MVESPSITMPLVEHKHRPYIEKTSNNFYLSVSQSGVRRLRRIRIWVNSTYYNLSNVLYLKTFTVWRGRQMTKVNLHINHQTLDIREATRECSIMHGISMWGISPRAVRHCRIYKIPKYSPDVVNHKSSYWLLATSLPLSDSRILRGSYC